MTCARSGTFNSQACTVNTCTPTQVSNSNFADAASITGTTGQVSHSMSVFMSVSCSFFVWISDLIIHVDRFFMFVFAACWFIPIVLLLVLFVSLASLICQAQTVTCNAGYTGGGTATCETNGTFSSLTCTESLTDSNIRNASSLWSSNVFNATFLYGSIQLWDVSKVTSLRDLFTGASGFNSDVSDWDVSKVDSMEFTWKSAVVFNSDLSKWDVSKVTSMFATFQSATAFNGDISNWDVSKVDSMELTWKSAVVFNRDLSKWDVSKVEGFANSKSICIFENDVT